MGERWIKRKRDDMAEKRVSEISKADSYEKMGEFWDTHSLADYDDEIDEVEITFEPSARRTWIGIDPELMAQLRDIARERRITTQTLVNLWLSQRVAELRSKKAA